MERLTALAVPRQGEPFLVVPAAGGAEGRRRPGGRPSVSRWSHGTRPTTRSRCSPAGRGPPRLPLPGRGRSTIVGRPHVRRAGGLPGSSLAGAEPARRPAPDVKSTDEMADLRAGRAPRWTGCTPRMGECLHVGRTEGRGGRHRRGDPGGGPRDVDFAIVGSGPNGAPAPRTVRPRHPGRRPGRRRHRRDDGDRLLLRLHPH